MTLTRFNPYSLLLAVCICAVVLLPAAVEARESESRGAKRIGTTLCDRIESAVKTIERELTERNEMFEQDREHQERRITGDRGSLDVQRKEKRAGGNAKLTEQLAALANQAQTPEAQRAVEIFTSAVTTALADHRYATDRTVSDFRQALDALVTERKGRVDAARNALLSGTRDAIARARRSCVANTPSSFLQLDLKMTLQSLQEQYRTEMRALESGAVSRKSLGEAQQRALAHAEQKLRETLALAKAEFLRSFP